MKFLNDYVRFLIIKKFKIVDRDLKVEKEEKYFIKHFFGIDAFETEI